eukprot:COSAG02_NODE_6913_length_3291_cov_48.607143_2_plen_71_part_00
MQFHTEFQYDPAQDRRAVNEHSIDSYNDSYHDGIGHEFFSFIRFMHNPCCLPEYVYTYCTAVQHAGVLAE